MVRAGRKQTRHYVHTPHLSHLSAKLNRKLQEEQSMIPQRCGSDCMAHSQFEIGREAVWE
jgi:hypothetical protein